MAQHQMPNVQLDRLMSRPAPRTSIPVVKIYSHESTKTSKVQIRGQEDFVRQEPWLRRYERMWVSITTPKRCVVALRICCISAVPATVGKLECRSQGVVGSETILCP